MMDIEIPKMIYLDNAATTFPKPECVYRFVDNIQRNVAVNSGRGGYKMARIATEIIDETRKELAGLVQIQQSSHVIIGPSDTYAANQIIMGLDWSTYSVIYISPYEHNAIVRPLWKMKEKYGFQIKLLPTDPNSKEIDIQAMQESFKSMPPDYVFLTHISNVTGYILPIEEIAKCAKQYNAKVIVDAAQSLGLVSVNMGENIDIIIFAGHKNLYANFGVGGFIVQNEDLVDTVFSGGTGSDSLNHQMPTSLPGKYEAASPNILAIASLCESIKWINTQGQKSILAHKKETTEYLINRLSANSHLTLYLPQDHEAHIGVVSFNHDNYQASDVGALLDEDYGIAVRTGYHCAPFVHEVIGSLEKEGTVRASVSYFTTKEDIDALASALESM
jgi:cysteine desulfurase family protein